MMKKLIATLLTSLFLGTAAWCRAHSAAAGGIEWDKFPKEKMTDMAALQNGAKLFVNYCLNCHSAAYHALQPSAATLGLTEVADQGQSDVRNGEKVGETDEGRRSTPSKPRNGSARRRRT